MSLIPHVDYFYDLTGTNAYVLLNGDPARVTAVIAFLKENGILCTGSGVSKYPARSGAQYQWFIRVTDASGEKPQTTAIHNLMRDFRHDAQGQQEREQFDARFADLSAKLRDKVEENNALAQDRERWSQTANAHAAQIEELDLTVELLQKELEDSKQRTQKYGRQLEEAEAFVAEFTQGFDELRDTNNVNEQRLIALTAENEQLKERLSTCAETLSTGQPTELAARVIEDLASILACLMPNVSFKRDSLDVMGRLADPLPIFKCLGQIVIEKKNGKKVQGAERWWEKHFSTGQDRVGRIYYRPENGGYDILVSVKQNQDPDIISYLSSR